MSTPSSAPTAWVSPDTDTIPHNVGGQYQKRAYEYCAGYRHGDKTIVGFSHTHFSGTGHSDLGDILVMPSVGDVKFNPGTADDPDSGYRSRFSHESESASPGYYAVTLDDTGVRAELTATPRTGVHRYTFPENADGHVVLDLAHGIYNYDGKVLWAGPAPTIPILRYPSRSPLPTTAMRIVHRCRITVSGAVSM